MFPILIGLIAATLFGIAASMFLGPSALLTNAWVDVVFWTLIASGAAVSAINLSWGCIPCHFAQWMKRKDLSDRLCRQAPCA